MGLSFRVTSFWAVGLNFEYTVICADEVDIRDWGSIEGPFRTLEEAKKQVREWIKFHRWHLTCELHEVNKLKVKDLIRSKL